jgi:hypothetical protein
VGKITYLYEHIKQNTTYFYEQNGSATSEAFIDASLDGTPLVYRNFPGGLDGTAELAPDSIFVLTTGGRSISSTSTR